MIELKYKKNEKFEIEFENLDEVKEGANDVLLKLKDGNLTPLIKAFYNTGSPVAFFIPYLPDIQLVADMFTDISFGTYNVISCTTFDYNGKDNLIKNIIPNWSKYIDEDSAVLFLSEKDCDKYNNNDEYDTYFIYPNGLSPRERNSEMDIKDWSKTSIIIPELTSKNIQEINDIAKELKEKYGVERVELFVSHCFGKINYGHSMDIEFDYVIGFNYPRNGLYYHIDKITTTNSTGALDVYDSERLKVVDVVEFFG